MVGEVLEDAGLTLNVQAAPIERSDQLFCSTMWTWSQATGFSSQELGSDGCFAFRDLEALPGLINPGSLLILNDLAAIVRRCAPWITLILAPKIKRQNDDFMAGIAFIDANRICATIRSPVGATQTVHHEIFHAIEKYLPPGSSWLIRDQARHGGQAWPEGYYDSDVERAARLYENFASFLDEGGEFMAQKTSEGIDYGTPALNLMHQIYSGSFARSALARTAARKAEKLRLERRSARIDSIKKLVGLSS